MESVSLQFENANSLLINHLYFNKINNNFKSLFVIQYRFPDLKSNEH